MMRLVIYLLTIALIATGLSWLADQPGTLQINWQGYDIQTTVFRAAVILAAATALAIFLWSILRAIWNGPSNLGHRIVRRRQKRGLEALSSGLIAASAGDQVLASRYAQLARKSLPHEPLTQLLRAQAAQLSGDRTTARRIYEAMLAAPETEQAGLRGLYLEAQREGASEAAQQFAGRALKSNPKLAWSSDALFDTQCKTKDWAGALETLASAKRMGRVAKGEADRKRAVLLTAQAIAAEENETDKAIGLAMEAHNLAPDLVPAAAVAGRIFAARGATAKAAKVLQKTWLKAPHPDLASAYAYARVGDSTRDRVERIKQLAAINPHSIESPIAVATTAIEARFFDEARAALQPLLANRLTQRVATLMARLEAGDTGDQGRVREWLARAATAPRDPVWIADGVISDTWEPTSPVDGRLDAFQWRVPLDTRDAARAEIEATRLEELLAIGAGPAQPNEKTVEAAVTVSSPNVDAGGSGSKPKTRRDDVVDVEPVTVVTKPVSSSMAADAPADAMAAPASVTITPGPAGNAKDDRKPASPAAGASAPKTQHGEAAVEVTRTQGAAKSSAAPAAAVAAVKPAAAVTAPAQATAALPVTEPVVMPLGHAPDDPGPDEPDGDEQPYPRRNFRAAR